MNEPAHSELRNDLAKLSSPARKFLAGDHRMLIGGRRVDAESGAALEVVDPTSGDVLGAVPAGDAKDVDLAVKSARAALESGPWSRMKPVERERLMLRLAQLLEESAEELAEIESVNSGRTIPNTRAFDVNLSVDYLRYMAGWSTKIHGETFSPSVPYVPDTNFFSYTLREPIGVVGAITPWNVPLGQAIWKIAPVLATGCTMVLKPAEQTPLTALRFAELIIEAGIPEGVVNIVTGLGETAGAALVDHPDVDKIAFTGSTEIGHLIASRCAGTLKRYTLELGGKSAMLVFPDADPEVTIPGTAMAIFGNHGQNCCAGSRLYIHKDIFEEHMAGVAEFARNIRLGSALDPQTEMGPLVSMKQRERVLGYVESGVSDGAEIVTGGCGVTESGAYVEPTVIQNVRPDMKIVQEEIFGPVLVASPFDDLDDVVRQANATQFGLGASIWTNDLRRTHSLIPRLKAGTVWVNTHNVLDLAVPFGGVKRSGVGRELGEEAIRHHTELKTVTMPV
ncbi:aldehyde dehydrogenase family protein [Elongatibacter sediminis]|uniref:Aldehyde dehydrogenase family protein n=1 Tax=Elongatibacter sediminis TaxID=3119006 RepID=A0AAW9R5P7_9GAMM